MPVPSGKRSEEGTATVKRGRIHRIFRRILSVVAGIVGILTILVLIGPRIRSWQMERAIARFEEQPSQNRADNLVDLIQTHAGTDEQGSRALALLLRPKIVTRKAYAAGRPVTIATELPFKLAFRRFLWKEEAIAVNEQEMMQYHGSDSLDHGTLRLNVPIFYTQPGAYPVKLRIQCSMGIERTSRLTTALGYLHDGVPWLIPEPAAWQPARTYKCDFTVSSEVQVVDHDAEKVELVSSPELDQAMRAAFSAGHSSMETMLSTPAGPRWVRGSALIHYENIPLAAAFRVILRLPDGREIPQYGVWPREFSARAGSSGSFQTDPSGLTIEAPGRHKATLILVPDPNLAYKDPTIKAIWNGTLEFPISFFIDVNEPRR
jgi:hypothetical protein